MGEKAVCAVRVQDLLGVFQYPCGDRGADQPGDEHLTNDAHALKLSGSSLGNQIADLRAEHAHSREIAAHHEQRTDKYRHCAAAEPEQYIAASQHCESGPDAPTKAHPVIDSAIECRYERREQNCGRKNQNIVFHFQRLLVVNQQIRHKHLYGNAEHGEECQNAIKPRMRAHRGRAKAVLDGAQQGSSLRL